MSSYRTLTVALGARSYPVLVGPGLLQQAGLLLTHLPQRRVALVSNDTLLPLYGKALAARLSALGVQVFPITLPDGEQFKTQKSLDMIYDAMLEAQLDRKSTIIALGGGVIGDLAGYAAATFQRGVPFLQIPTTLLAQVDSSVGGKTAINHPRGKNLIGAFHQPRLVIADTDVLATLPDRELKAGLAEIIKYGLIRDPEFFVWLEQNMDALLERDATALATAVFESCRNKSEVVAADELETGERALLNFGHTFGHAIEAALGFGEWLHGEAVAAGMVMAARLSAQCGYLESSEVGRIEKLISRAGLPIAGPSIPAEKLLAFMDHDKKTEAGIIRLILLKRVGTAHVDSSIARGKLLQFLSSQSVN